jgi:uncharacterized protein (TIGR03067 family)
MRLIKTAAGIAALALAAGLASQGWSAPAAPAAPAAPRDAASPPVAAGPVDPRIEGVWVVDTAERQMEPYKDLDGATFTFKGDSFDVDRPGHSHWSGHVATDVKTGRIDLHQEADNLVPPKPGDTWQGIYKFDGPELVINTAQTHDARPTEFLSGYDLALIKLKKKG